MDSRFLPNHQEMSSLLKLFPDHEQDLIQLRELVLSKLRIRLAMGHTLPEHDLLDLCQILVDRGLFWKS